MLEGRTVMEAFAGSTGADEIKQLVTEVENILGIGKKAKAKKEAA
jgi:hypothetical protein